MKIGGCKRCKASIVICEKNSYCDDCNDLFDWYFHYGVNTENYRQRLAELKIDGIIFPKALKELGE